MYDMQANAKEFLSRMEGALTDFHEAFNPIGNGPPKYYFKKMTQWIEALFAKGPFKVGDKVQLVRVPQIDKESGWWHCRKTFTLGAIGKVVHMDFRDGCFHADVVWDEDWVELNYPTPHWKQVDPEKRHMFGMWESSLVRYNPSHVLWVPWRGTPEQEQGEPRATIWEKEVKPHLGPGSHIQPKHFQSNLLGWVITNPVIDEV